MENDEENMNKKESNPHPNWCGEPTKPPPPPPPPPPQKRCNVPPPRPVPPIKEPPRMFDFQGKTLKEFSKKTGIKLSGTEALINTPEAPLGFEAHGTSIFLRWYCDHEEVKGQVLSQVARGKTEAYAKKVAEALNKLYPKGEGFN